jgi:hypothetical protein
MAFTGKEAEVGIALAASATAWGTETAIGAGDGVTFETSPLPAGNPSTEVEKTIDTPFGAYVDSGNVEAADVPVDISYRFNSGTGPAPQNELLMSCLYNATTSTQQAATAAYLHTGTITGSHGISYAPVRFFSISERIAAQSGYKYKSAPSWQPNGFELKSEAGKPLTLSFKGVANRIIFASAVNGSTQHGNLTYMDRGRKCYHYHLDNTRTNCTNAGLWFAKAAAAGASPATFAATEIVHPESITISYDPKLAGTFTDARYSDQPTPDSMGELKVSIKWPKLTDALYAQLPTDLKAWESDTESYYHFRARWQWATAIATTYYPYLEIGMPKLQPTKTTFQIVAGKRVPLECELIGLAPNEVTNLPTCFLYGGGAAGAAMDPIYAAIMSPSTAALIA